MSYAAFRTMFRPVFYPFHRTIRTLALGLAVGSAAVLNGVAAPAMAKPVLSTIAQPTCPATAEHTPADEMRTVELVQFGVELSIPENFRAMARQDGSVSILSPFEFNQLQCLAQGLPVLGTELESEDFRLVDNPNGRSAMDYAEDFASDPSWFSVSDFVVEAIDGVEVVMLEVSGGYEITYAWYQPVGTDSLVEISAFSQEEIVDLLSRTRFPAATAE